LDTKFRVSSKPALFLVYLLMIVLVVALLVREEGFNTSSFLLTNSRLLDDLDAKTLVVEGENLHSGIKGVLAKTLINEDALLWHQFTDVPLRVFDVKGKRVLFSYKGGKLVSGAFPEKAKVKLQGALSVAGDVLKLKIIDSKALVGLTRGQGLSLVDMSDPENLKLMSHYPLEGIVSSMVTAKNSFYFTGYKSGVLRLDLDAENSVPEMLVDMDSPWCMAIDGKRVAVGTLKGVVALFEIDKTGRLVEVGRLDFPGQVRGVAFTEGALTIVFDDSHLSVYSLSTWPKLIRSGRLRLPAQSMDVKPVPGQERVVVSLVRAGLGLVDVSQQKTPELDGWFKVPKTYRGFNVEPEMILGTSIEGLDAISIEKLEAGGMSKLAPEAMVGGSSYRLRSWHQHIYGVDSQGVAKVLARAPNESPVSEAYLPIVDKQGVRLYKKAEDGQLVSVGSVAIKEGALSARLHKDYLYVVYREGLRVFQVKGPDELIIVGDLSISGLVLRFEILGSGTVMVATNHQGVLIVDISDPTQPTQTSRLTLPHNLEGSVVRGILVDGQRAYLSQGTSGVNVVDISAPQHPEVLQLLDTPGFASTMALHDDLLFVADAQKGLFIIDVKGLERALPVGSLRVPIRISELAVAADGLLASSLSRGGTMKLPMPQRLQGLRQVSDSEVRIDLPVAEKGHYVYLYDGVTSERVALDVPELPGD
jgi:hypothetical protein